MKPPVLITKLADAWPEIRRAHFTVDCCLNASRVWIDALTVVMPQAKVRPLVVHAVASNPQAQRLLLDPDLTIERWRAEGARLLDVGTPRGTGPGWPGHLVVIVNNRFLVDPSAEQMDRPTLSVPPTIIAPIGKRFLSGRSSIALRMSDDSLICYEARPTERSYLDMPGFQPHAANAVVTSRLLRAVMGVLAGACVLACGGSEFSAGADLHDPTDSGPDSAGMYPHESDGGGGTGGVTPASGSGGTHAGAGGAVTGGHSAAGGTVNGSGGSPAAGGGVGTGGGASTGGAPPTSGGSSGSGGSGGALATGGAQTATGGALGAGGGGTGSGGSPPAWLYNCGYPVTCPDPATCPLGNLCCLGPIGSYTGCGCTVQNPSGTPAFVCR
jgi:hypothetical protein